MKKSKCWDLRLGWGSPGGMYRVAGEGVESSPTKRDLGILGLESELAACPGSHNGQLYTGEHQVR